MVTVCAQTGLTVLDDQLNDYRYRGEELESYSFFDFCVGTYETAIRETTHHDDNDQDAGTMVGRGRPANSRVAYLVEANKPRKCRVVRTIGHETLPRFSSRWFPTSDEPGVYPLYCASVLLLLCPWRSLETLRGDSPTFSEAFQTFLAGCSPRNLRIIENLQFYHTCARDAKAEAQSRAIIEVQGDADDSMGGEDTTESFSQETVDEAVEEMLRSVTEDDIRSAERAQIPDRELLYAQSAVLAGKGAGFFLGEDDEMATSPRVAGMMRLEASRATDDQMEHVGSWATILDQATRAATNNPGDLHNEGPQDPGVYEAGLPMVDDTVIPPGVEARPPISHQQSVALNEEQQRAHDIIRDHLANTLAGMCAPLTTFCLC
jgi:hypothetical protein